MTSIPLEIPATFSSRTKIAFLQYLQDNPNSRRVSRSEKQELINWLIDPNVRPSSQKEFSRRHYVRKTFTWDERSQSLQTVARKDGEIARTLVTDDIIADTVEFVHKENGHAGWDTTWKDVSGSYYGVLRADVIYLLKRCQTCAGNPRKRPKGATTTTFDTPSAEQGEYDNLNVDTLLNGSSMNVLEDEERSAEYYWQA
ncbi:hypothetical protein MMC25_001314 [Agyrium rufum]|nr:hypothetical protein [Agyrium rufum]